MTDPWDVERDLQGKELADILQTEINRYGKSLTDSGRQPLLNAVAGALVTVMGGMLASVEDPRLRTALRREMERKLPQAIAINEGRGGSASVIVAGQRADA